MRNNFFLLLYLILYSLSVGFACDKSDSKVETQKGAKALSADAERVVEYLITDWANQFRSTDISTAMDNLGLKQDDYMRLQIGQHFRDNTNLARNLRFWGANNYILNNDEKRIAKYIMFSLKKENRYPTLFEAMNALEITEEYLKQRLEYIEETGLIFHSDNQFGYELIADHDTWGGPLRYNYHTVSVEGEKPFGVW